MLRVQPCLRKVPLPWPLSSPQPVPFSERVTCHVKEGGKTLSRSPREVSILGGPAPWGLSRDKVGRGGRVGGRGVRAKGGWLVDAAALLGQSRAARRRALRAQTRARTGERSGRGRAWSGDRRRRRASGDGRSEGSVRLGPVGATSCRQTPRRKRPADR